MGVEDELRRIRQNQEQILKAMEERAEIERSRWEEEAYERSMRCDQSPSRQHETGFDLTTSGKIKCKYCGKPMF